MDVQARVVNYFKNNTFIQKYLKGIDSKTSEVVFNYNGESRRMTIDDLENKIKNENDLISFFEGRLINPSVKNEQNNEVMTSVTNNPTYKQEEIIEDTIEPSLYDIVVLTELKNKEGMDNLLKKFAVNESTGLIDLRELVSFLLLLLLEPVLYDVFAKQQKHIEELEEELSKTKFDLFEKQKEALSLSNEKEQIEKKSQQLEEQLTGVQAKMNGILSVLKGDNE